MHNEEAVPSVQEAFQDVVLNVIRCHLGFEQADEAIVKQELYDSGFFIRFCHERVPHKTICELWDNIIAALESLGMKICRSVRSGWDTSMTFRTA